MKAKDLAAVREHANVLAERSGDEDAPLDFYAAALELGFTKPMADHIDERLTIQVMTARGAI